MIFEDEDDIFDKHLPKRELEIAGENKADSGVNGNTDAAERRGSVNFKSMHTEMESKANRRRSLLKVQKRQRTSEIVDHKLVHKMMANKKRKMDG